MWLARVISIRLVDSENPVALGVKPPRGHKLVNRASRKEGWIELEHGLRPECSRIKLGLDLSRNSRICDFDETWGVTGVVPNKAIAEVKYVHTCSSLAARPNAVFEVALQGLRAEPPDADYRDDLAGQNAADWGSGLNIAKTQHLFVNPDCNRRIGTLNAPLTVTSSTLVAAAKEL